jgi:hypothetical protein
MSIDVQLENGNLLKVLLRDVLYTQDMGINLVSISLITAAGHMDIFNGPSLKIFSSVKSYWGRYWLTRDSTTSTTLNLLTLQWKL